ncbi:MAG: hypothetical protein OHK0052_06700 [Anaerolineales bacterium]
METSFTHATPQSQHFRKIFEAVRKLSPSERLQLQLELNRLNQIHQIPPSQNDEQQQRGRAMAEQIRLQLAQNEHQTTLEETMAALRGREWSS